MVTTPVETPLTTPEVETVAIPVLPLLHVPPVDVSAKVIVELTQTVLAPVIGAGKTGNGLTVTVATDVPPEVV